jgi:hypothetical protein
MIRLAIVIVTEIAARAVAAVGIGFYKMATMLVGVALWLRRVGRGR